MKNTIAESKTTDLIVQVNYKDDHIIRGQVLVGDEYNHIGKVDYWSTSSFTISNNNNTDIPNHYNNDNGTLYKIAKDLQMSFTLNKSFSNKLLGILWQFETYACGFKSL